MISVIKASLVSCKIDMHVIKKQLENIICKNQRGINETVS